MTPPPSTPADWVPWPRGDFEARREAARRDAYQPLLSVAVAVCGGIAADRFGGFGAGAAGPAILLLVLWRTAWRRRAERSAGWLLLVAVAAAAAAWHHQHWRQYAADDLGRFAADDAQPVCFDAIAVTSPVFRDPAPPTPLRAIPQVASSSMLLRAVRLRDGEAWRRVSGRCELVVYGHLVGVAPGDRLRVFGQLRRPPRATNPGQFDPGESQRAARRLCRVRAESPDCVGLLERGSGMSWRRVADRVRRSAIASLDRFLPPRQADLAAAMLLGARERTPREVAELFRRVGAVHVLVVSGLHVGLVVAGCWLAARWGWLPSRGAIVAMMALAVAYGLLAGGRPPVLRALVLAEAMGVAALVGRRAVAFNSLAAAALVVLAINPAELFRAGTQLSFLATGTLIWYGGRQRRAGGDDPLDRLIASTRPWWRRGLSALANGGRLLITATLAVWLVTAPLLLYRYHLLSPAALPLALVVFPLTAIAVPSGLCVVLLGWVGPWLCRPPAAVCGAALSGLESALTAADRAPGAHVWLPGPTWWWTLGVYGLLAAAVVFRLRRTPRRVLNRVGLAWLSAAFAPWLLEAGGPATMRATFIDVGHGASVLIEAPDGGVVLYDAGSLASPELAADTIAGVLWSRGVLRIDALLLSHADVDHFNAVPSLLERFRVGGVYVSPHMLPPTPVSDDDWSAPAELRRRLTEHGVPVHELRMGDQMTLGDLRLEALHPTPFGVIGTDNANSLVIAAESAGRRVLLPGDLEAEGLEFVIRQEPYDCDVLLAPHHGSERSDPPGFASWCRPEWVVISGRHAADEAASRYRAAGAGVLHTGRSGAITLLMPENTPIEVRRWRGE